MRRFVRYQLPAILWAMLIFGLSSIPGLSTPEIGIKPTDKLAHLVEFGIFGYLITRAFYHSNFSLRRYSIALGITLGILYALSDEFHQSFVPGRDVSLGDIIADSLGVVLAQIMFIKFNICKQHKP